jgi:L-lactate dehydrogenase complex protein LldF
VKPTPHNLRRSFRAGARDALSDARLGAALRKTTDLLLDKRAAAAEACAGFGELRDWGRARKWEASGRLVKLAREFAGRVEAAGGRVHFARDATDVAEVVTRIARDRGARTAVKAKSMTAEEVELNDALEAAGTEVTETDLGEFIIQLAGEKPSHIMAPAIHRDRSQVGELFHRTLGTEPGLDVESLVAAARAALRKRFLAADLGITGANFAVAETGTLVLVTNEGNGRMATTLPPVHIALVGIDKVIPRLSDVPGLLALLTRSASGQAISTYVTLVTGPRRAGEEEGPEELHVVLLDNGRSRIAEGPFREMLHCLHCGACLNHCPVYRAVGGHAYESPYPGPMGDVLSPLLWGIEAFPDLPDACTLCGRCQEACPVRIPLPAFHRELRRLTARPQRRVARLLAAAASSPALYRLGIGFVRRALRRPAWIGGRGFAASWGSCRELPCPAAEPSFRAWWKGRKGSSR